MISANITSLPALAGASLSHRLVRAVRWAFGQFMSAPLQNTGIALLAFAIVLAANNALFLQSAAHPAPLFFSASDQEDAAHLEAPPSALTPSAPTPMPPPVALRSVQPTTPLVQEPVAVEPQPLVSDPVHDDGKVSNDQLAQAQTALQTMGLFSGKIDGFYGPKTAEAFRAFEARNGMAPKGALSASLVTLILQAPVIQESSARSVLIEQTIAPVEEISSQPQPAPIAQPIAQIVPALPAELDPLSVIAQSASQQVTAISAPPPQAQPVAVDDGAAEVRNIQRALASLGFLHGAIDGIAGESTARAIRNFEVYNNYQVTGLMSPELIDLLKQAGATL